MRTLSAVLIGFLVGCLSAGALFGVLPTASASVEVVAGAESGAGAAADFALRGLEIHSSRMWRWDAVVKALDVMERLQLNALIFHQVDLTDALVLPEAYLPADWWLHNDPVHMHQVLNRRQYIRQVAREARRRGIRFYIEVKEIWFAHGLLEKYPQLIAADGSICPCDSFWWEFVRNKYRELLKALPEIEGVIVSPASRESRVTIANNKSDCDSCRQYDKKAWYAQLLRAMYEPLAEAGKTLVVRDFAYTAEQQSLAVQAASEVSAQIVIAMKYTPRDYYPNYPDNPKIGNAGAHPQWVEFDAWGQYFGMGFFPCSVVEDMQRRLEYAKRNGVSGVWIRTDWEGMLEASAFNSFNLLNLFGFGLLSRQVDSDVDQAYAAWMKYGLADAMVSDSAQPAPQPVPERNREALRDFMRASWKVLEKTLYVRGNVWHEDEMFPDRVYKPFYITYEAHNRAQWEPAAHELIEPTDANLAAIFAEKAAAVEEVGRLPALLKIDELELSDRFKRDLRTQLSLYEWYVRGQKECAQVVFQVRQAQQTGRPEDVEKAASFVGSLSRFSQDLAQALQGTAYPHYVYWFLDTGRLRSLMEDARATLAAVKVGGAAAPAVGAGN